MCIGNIVYSIYVICLPLRLPVHYQSILSSQHHIEVGKYLFSLNGLGSEAKRRKDVPGLEALAWDTRDLGSCPCSTTGTLGKPFRVGFSKTHKYVRCLNPMPNSVLLKIPPLESLCLRPPSLKGEL